MDSEGENHSDEELEIRSSIRKVDALLQTNV